MGQQTFGALSSLVKVKTDPMASVASCGGSEAPTANGGYIVTTPGVRSPSLGMYGRPYGGGMYGH
jgi:hypothetical protein